MPLAPHAIAPALRCLLAVAALAASAGCATLTVVPGPGLHEQRLTPAAEPVAHIYAANWGVYLFKYVPLVTGSLSRPGQPLPAFFSNQVQVDLLVHKVSEESKRRGGTVITDLQTRDKSYWMPYSLILWLNEYEVSANASRAPTSQ
jgi:hypothetical protein